MVREYQYELRGPQLLHGILLLLNDLDYADPVLDGDPRDEEDPALTLREMRHMNQHETLAELNDQALDLGALNTEWFEFSAAVFLALMSPSANTIKALRPLFRATLERLAVSL